MSNRIEMSPQLKAFLAAPEAPDDGRNAFSVHGIWAPGVQFMRRVSFQSKALIITALFLVPLAFAGYAFVTTQQSQIDFSNKELVGLAYAKQVTPLTGQLQLLRKLQVQWAYSGKEPGELAGARTALQQQLQKVQVAQQTHGAQLGTEKALVELKAAVDKLPTATTGADVHTALKAY
jgi:hypothetical protein